MDYAKNMDDLPKKKRGSVRMFKKIRDAKRLLPISISGYWKSSKNEAQRSHIFNSLREASFFSTCIGEKYVPSATKKKACGGRMKGEGRDHAQACSKKVTNITF